MKNAKIFEIPKKDFLIILFLVSLIIRISFILLFGNIREPNTVEHGIIAKNMLNGYGFSMHWLYPSMSGPMLEYQKQPPKFEGAFIPPLNPFIIFVFFKIFGESSFAYLLLMILNSIFSSLFVLVIYNITKELSDEKASRISGIISMLFLPSVVGVTTFSGTSLYQLLAGLVLLFAIKAYRYGHQRNFLLFGVFSGLLTLTRSEFLIFYFVILFVLIMLLFRQKKTSTNNILKSWALSFTVFFLIVSPWIIRNTVLFNQFTTIISHPWHELWRGNNTHSSGGASSKYQLNIWVRKHQYPDIIKKIDMLPYNQNFELATDKIFKEEVLKFWSENPFETLKIWIKRALFTLSIDPYTPKARNPVYIAFILFSLFTAVIGYNSIRRNKSDKDYSHYLFLTFLISYLVLISVVNLETRYQIYLFSMIHPFSGLGIIEIYRKIAQRNFRTKINTRKITVFVITCFIFIYLSLLYIEKDKEYKNFKNFEKTYVAGKIEKIEKKEEKAIVKLTNENKYFEFHPGYIEDEITNPFLNTAKSGDSIFKESNAENLFLFSNGKVLKYRYIIIYDNDL